MRNLVIQKLEEAKGNKSVRLTRASLIRINTALVNVRTANRKAGAKYWFDVTPSFFKSVDFFLFACGNSTTVYIFPSLTLQQLIVGASLGGHKQVPNFTIYVDRNELEPAGQSKRRVHIGQYLNDYSLIP